MNEKVKCNWCEWEGYEKDLIIDTVGIDEVEFCPQCHKNGFLMDIEER